MVSPRSSLLTNTNTKKNSPKPMRELSVEDKQKEDSDPDSQGLRLLQQIIGLQSKVHSIVGHIYDCKEEIKQFNLTIVDLNASLKK